jgi:hypothetical protein
MRNSVHTIAYKQRHLFGHRVVVPAPLSWGERQLEVAVYTLCALLATAAATVHSPAYVERVHPGDGRAARDAADSQRTQEAPSCRSRGIQRRELLSILGYLNSLSLGYLGTRR